MVFPGETPDSTCWNKNLAADPPRSESAGCDTQLEHFDRLITTTISFSLRRKVPLLNSAMLNGTANTNGAVSIFALSATVKTDQNPIPNRAMEA
jgi:hypothetical protein